MQVTRGVAPPRPCLSAGRHAAGAGRDREEHSASKGRATAAEGVGVITLPDNRWERVDIKSVGLLPNAHRQAEGEGGRRLRGLVRRPRRLRHRRRVHHGLDRDEGRRRSSPARTAPTSCPALPASRRPRSPGAKGCRSRSGNSRSRRRRPRARPSSPRRARSSCRSSAIDGETVANGHPGSIATRLRAAFHDVAEKLRA